jgi:uncharacterized protein
MMHHQPMTEREYQQLGATLARFQEQQCMSLEQLDGFFTALLCGPMPVKPTECLQIILGPAFDDEAAFPSAKALERFGSLLHGHWLDIAATLREGRPFHPWLQEDEDGKVNGHEWAKGFMEGMQLMNDDWAMLFDDPEQSQVLEPIMALAFQDQPDDEMRAYLESADAEQTAVWVAEITPSVEAIYRFFSAVREELEEEDEE